MKLTDKMIAEIEARATAFPPDLTLLVHEKYCRGFFGCTPDGCPGHPTSTARFVDGLAMDAATSNIVDAEQAAQANAEAKFIAGARQDILDLVAELRIYKAIYDYLGAP